MLCICSSLPLCLGSHGFFAVRPAIDGLESIQIVNRMLCNLAQQIRCLLWLPQDHQIIRFNLIPCWSLFSPLKKEKTAVDGSQASLWDLGPGTIDSVWLLSTRQLTVCFLSCVSNGVGAKDDDHLFGWFVHLIILIKSSSYPFPWKCNELLHVASFKTHIVSFIGKTQKKNPVLLRCSHHLSSLWASLDLFLIFDTQSQKANLYKWVCY